MRHIFAIFLGFLGVSPLTAQGEVGSRVLLLFDVSNSMNRVADAAGGKLRQDAVLDLLTDEKAAFLSRLEAKAPVVAYRFGLFRHFDPVHVWKGKVFLPEEWSAVERDSKAIEKVGRAWKRADWEAWLRPNLDLDPPKGLSLEAEREWMIRQVALGRAVVGTDVARAILEAFRDLGKYRVLGAVVFSDGRDTLASLAATSLEQAARMSGTPVFTVPVGGDVSPHRATLAGVRAPTLVQPSEFVPVVVGVAGVGMAGKSVPLTLQVTRPGGKTESKEVTLNFKDDLARVEREFKFDAGKDEGPWTFVAKLPVLKGETVRRTTIQGPPVQVQVLKRRARVLLFADSANREYQFLNNFLLRVAERGQVELTVLLQARSKRIRDEDPHVLTKFPHRLGERPKLDEADHPSDLTSYDLIVAVDPDWTKLSADELKNLHAWVTKWGGGLVLAAGTVNTPALGLAKNGKSLERLLDLLPVVPEDFKGWEDAVQAEEPRALKFDDKLADFPFLSLGEKVGKGFEKEWMEFFYGETADKKEKTVEAGFFSFYPIREVKAKATVLARVADDKIKNKKGELQPWLAHLAAGKGQVLWLGSAETWRLRQSRESYHESFWGRLAPALAGSIGETGVDRLLVPQGATKGGPAALEVRLFGKDGKPLPAGSRVLAHIDPPLDGMHATSQLKPVRGGGDFAGLFRLEFTPPAARTYKVRVPNAERATSLTATFAVTDVEPELMDLRPDAAALRRLATPAEVVLKALPKEKREALAKVLGTPARLGVPIRSAGLIPDAVGLKEVPVKTLAQVFDRKSQPDLQFAEIKADRKVKLNASVEFTVTIKNPAIIDVSAPLLRVFVDGEEDFLGATVVGKVEAGKTSTATFSLSFAKEGKRKVTLRLQGGKSDGGPLVSTLEIEVEK